MTTPSPEPVACPECQALVGHSIHCSRQTVEEKAAQALHYYNAWLKNVTVYYGIIARLRKQVVFWQGKHAMLRLENNALRRKLKPKPSKA